MRGWARIGECRITLYELVSSYSFFLLAAMQGEAMGGST